jgi:folylpolyglutamate synthase/dihydropteroate synthase
MPAVALDTESKYQRLLELCNEMNEKRGRNVKTEVFDSVLEALNWASYSDRTIKTNVLITGSLYLVGLSLKVLNYRIA